MVSSEVQRTLVKSPPELWSELSDPDALARHLGELGEIRITRVTAEEQVEWEAENTSGTVVIKPSGWGTRVTLSVTRELSPPGAGEAASSAGAHSTGEADSTDAEADPMPDSDASADAPAAAEPAAAAEMAGAEPSIAAEASPEAVVPLAPITPEQVIAGGAGHPLEIAETAPVEAAGEPAPASAQPAPPRRGLFARLFGRRSQEGQGEPLAVKPITPVAPAAPRPQDRAGDLAAELAAVAARARITVPPAAPAPRVEPPVPPTETAPLQTKPAAGEAPEAQQQPTAGARPAPHAESVAEHAPAADITADLEAAEEAAAEEVTAVLTAALDRLGAAHHRPFSRS